MSKMRELSVIKEVPGHGSLKGTSMVDVQKGAPFEWRCLELNCDQIERILSEWPMSDDRCKE